MAKPELKDQPHNRENPVMDFELGTKFKPFERLTNDDIKKVEEGEGYTMAFRCRAESLGGAINLTNPAKTATVDDGELEWGDDPIEEIMYGKAEPVDPTYEVHFHWFSFSPQDLGRLKGFNVEFTIEGVQMPFNKAGFLSLAEDLQVIRASARVETIEDARRLEVKISRKLSEIPTNPVSLPRS